MDAKQQKLFDKASQQQGYFTAKQAVQAGYSYRMQTHYKQKNEWIEIERGVFRLAQFPNSPHEDYVKWSLWSRDRNDRPQAVISHESALSIHDLSDIMPVKIHMTVPQQFRKIKPKGCVIHKALIMDPEKEQREGFSVTSPLRTIVDSAESNLGLDYLEQAVKQACDKGILRIIDIASVDMPEKARRKIMMVFKNIMIQEERSK